MGPQNADNNEDDDDTRSNVNIGLWTMHIVQCSYVLVLYFCWAQISSLHQLVL
jgi:hypothetical protein